MTLQELSRHLMLQKQLARDEEILKSLEAAVHPGAQVLTGMPHAPCVSDNVGKFAVEIADIKTHISNLKEEIAVAEAEVTDYISTIEDSQTRMIFRLRFLRCMTWGEVAGVIGGRNTANSVKLICHRYLKQKS